MTNPRYRAVQTTTPNANGNSASAKEPARNAGPKCFSVDAVRSIAEICATTVSRDTRKVRIAPFLKEFVFIEADLSGCNSCVVSPKATESLRTNFLDCHRNQLTCATLISKNIEARSRYRNKSLTPHGGTWLTLIGSHWGALSCILCPAIVM